MHRTAVGYCGGETPDPSYRKVCNNEDYADYAEAVTIDFDPAVISYEGILDAFFRCHDAAAGGRSRQYASIIFAHDESQLAAANKAVAERPGVKTTVEEAVGERGLFWVAEAYHQKWLLQRKRPLFLALGMMEREELLGPAATTLNAVAAAKLPGRLALGRLEMLMERGEGPTPAAHGAISALLDPF